MSEGLDRQVLRGVDGARRAAWAKFYEHRELVMRSLAFQFVARKVQQSDPGRADILHRLSHWTLASADGSYPRDNEVFKAQRDAAFNDSLEDLAGRAGVPPHVLAVWIENAQPGDVTPKRGRGTCEPADIDWSTVYDDPDLGPSQ